MSPCRVTPELSCCHADINASASDVPMKFIRRDVGVHGDGTPMFAAAVSSGVVFFCVFSDVIFYYLRQGGYVIVVCLSVNNFSQKRPKGFASRSHGRLTMGQ